MPRAAFWILAASSCGANPSSRPSLAYPATHPPLIRGVARTPSGIPSPSLGPTFLDPASATGPVILRTRRIRSHRSLPTCRHARPSGSFLAYGIGRFSRLGTMNSRQSPEFPLDRPLASSLNKARTLSVRPKSPPSVKSHPQNPSTQPCVNGRVGLRGAIALLPLPPASTHFAAGNGAVYFPSGNTIDCSSSTLVGLGTVLTNIVDPTGIAPTGLAILPATVTPEPSSFLLMLAASGCLAAARFARGIRRSR